MADKPESEYATIDHLDNRCMIMFDDRKRAQYPVHWHTAFEIILALENTYTVICTQREFILGEGELLIIPAGELHSMPEADGRRIILLCDNSAVIGNPALSELYDIFAEPIRIEKDESGLSDSLRRAMLDLLSIYKSADPLSEIHLYSNLLRMLTEIKRYRLRDSEPEDLGKYTDKFRSVIRYIEKNFAKDISLDDLADMTGYSKFHFSRIFRKYYGLSFVEILNCRRLKEAETLLLSNDYSVTEIAERSGFSSLTTFNRIFREHKGCSPSEFRKLYHPKT